MNSPLFVNVEIFRRKSQQLRKTVGVALTSSPRAGIAWAKPPSVLGLVAPRWPNRRALVDGERPFVFGILAVHDFVAREKATIRLMATGPLLASVRAVLHRLFPLASFLLLSALTLSAQSQPKWEKLEGCTYKADQWNDGDSFHAMQDGKEYIFRLYFVDTPESNDRFPDRNAEQAVYFGINEKATLVLGEQAAFYTKQSLIESQTFTAWVCGQDAMGSSKIPRTYAIIEMPNGRNLAMSLVAGGLCRIYGKKITLPDGTSSKDYVAKLRAMEEKAKKAGMGGWGRIVGSTPTGRK